MSTPIPTAPRPQAHEPAGVHTRRRRRDKSVDTSERGIISFHDRKNTKVRFWTLFLGSSLLLALAVGSLGPLAWMFKAGSSTAQETLTESFGLWPSGIHWEFFGAAFDQVSFGTYLLNTLWVCLGTWAVGMIVSSTAGYLLAVLRPRYAPVLEGLVIATLLIPSVVSLVALYSFIVDVPILNVNLINTYWAIWFPMGVSSFNVLLMTRSFGSIPPSLFEAARIDGASNLRVFVSLVLPMSKPILGVVSLLTLVQAYKEFLWPMLVLRDSSLQPLSVALPNLEGNAPLPVYMAALFMALLVPVLLFLVFNKQFLRAAGSQGAIKE